MKAILNSLKVLYILKGKDLFSPTSQEQVHWMSLDLGRTFIQSDFPAGESETSKEVESLLLFPSFSTFHC